MGIRKQSDGSGIYHHSGCSYMTLPLTFKTVDASRTFWNSRGSDSFHNFMEVLNFHSSRYLWILNNSTTKCNLITLFTRIPAQCPSFIFVLTNKAVNSIRTYFWKNDIIMTNIGEDVRPVVEYVLSLGLPLPLLHSGKFWNICKNKRAEPF